MPYAFSFEVPGNRQLYRAVEVAIGPQPPAGLLAQLVTSTATGNRHTMLWESEADWEIFRSTRVAPAVAQTLTAAGIPVPEASPELEMLDVIDVWVPQALTKVL